VRGAAVREPDRVTVLDLARLDEEQVHGADASATPTEPVRRGPQGDGPSEVGTV
jgi:hypothetical protein